MSADRPTFNIHTPWIQREKIFPSEINFFVNLVGNSLIISTRQPGLTESTVIQIPLETDDTGLVTGLSARNPIYVFWPPAGGEGPQDEYLSIHYHLDESASEIAYVNGVAKMKKSGLSYVNNGWLTTEEMVRQTGLPEKIDWLATARMYATGVKADGQPLTGEDILHAPLVEAK